MTGLLPRAATKDGYRARCGDCAYWFRNSTYAGVCHAVGSGDADERAMAEGDASRAVLSAESAAYPSQFGIEQVRFRPGVVSMPLMVTPYEWGCASFEPRTAETDLSTATPRSLVDPRRRADAFASRRTAVLYARTCADGCDANGLIVAAPGDVVEPRATCLLCDLTVTVTELYPGRRRNAAEQPGSGEATSDTGTREKRAVRRATERSGTTGSAELVSDGSYRQSCSEGCALNGSVDRIALGDGLTVVPGPDFRIEVSSTTSCGVCGGPVRLEPVEP